MRRFTGMDRYSRSVSWIVVLSYLVQIFLAVGIGAYLLSFPAGFGLVALIIMTSVFIGTRLRGINNIVHECSHSSFSHEREDNVRIGKVCCALLSGCFKTYRDDHLSHHAHLGDYEHDNEFAEIESFRLHDPLTLKTVLRHFVTPLLGLHLSAYSKIDLTARDGRLFFALKIAVLLAMALFTLIAPLTSLLFVLLPMFFILPTINFWTDCLDHAGLVPSDDQLVASRNVLAPEWVRLVFFPRNDCYHLVHHLFPQVPARHLKVAHKQLCAEPHYRNQPTAVRPTHVIATGAVARSIQTMEAPTLDRIGAPARAVISKFRP